MDKLVRFVRHHHLVQLYAVVIVLLVQSMGKAKTFSCCYFPCLTVLLVYAPCDVRTAAVACGAGLLLIGCWRQSGKRAENRKRRGRRMVVGFTYLSGTASVVCFCLQQIANFSNFRAYALFCFPFQGKEKQLSNDGVFHLNHIQVLPYLSTRGRQSCNQC
jgi:hypothetical protein